MARIAIVRVGAIGGVVAALLGSTGRHHIELCTRRPLDSLTVETPDGTISVKAANVTKPERATAADWVLVATKTYDSKGAAAWFPHLCTPASRVAVLQNGVEHREQFATYLDSQRILPVVIDCPAERRQDGRVVQRGPVLMRVEEAPIGAQFASLFERTKTDVAVTCDFLTVAWRKLCVNSAGAILALVSKPAGVLRDEALGKVALDVIAECIAVGRAEGATLESAIGVQVLEGYRAGPPDSINSILADRLASRPMEIDARNGVIVRKGEKHGIATPVNRMIVALLREMGRDALA